ncbi:AraC family transcriptional regulator [Shewanella algae]|uniref:AraC family transcriptional regulator n=1 Tax=Shewanella algae TaxID=38313 RepID=UPI001FBBF0E7|nr:helix-turn-helix transcriptional regulator [Shewanella algae]
MPNRQAISPTDTLASEARFDANGLIAAYPDARVLSKVLWMPRGHVDSWHSHNWHQLVFPASGLLQTQVRDTRFILPHNGALFIPATQEHESRVLVDTQFIGLYLDPAYSQGFPTQAKPLAVSPFLRELLLHLTQAPSPQASDARLRLLAVLKDEVIQSAPYRLGLLLPKDKRLLRIFDEQVARPALEMTLAQWAERVGASERTLSRLFARELGCSYPLWRQHLRLLSSLTQLEQGETVQQVAFQAGYQSDSAFICAFKGLFDQTPHQYRSQNRPT